MKQLLCSLTVTLSALYSSQGMLKASENNPRDLIHLSTTFQLNTVAQPSLDQTQSNPITLSVQKQQDVLSQLAAVTKDKSEIKVVNYLDLTSPTGDEGTQLLKTLFQNVTKTPKFCSQLILKLKTTEPKEGAPPPVACKDGVCNDDKAVTAACRHTMGKIFGGIFHSSTEIQMISVESESARSVWVYVTSLADPTMQAMYKLEY